MKKKVKICKAAILKVTTRCCCFFLKSPNSTHSTSAVFLILNLSLFSDLGENEEEGGYEDQEDESGEEESEGTNSVATLLCLLKALPLYHRLLCPVSLLQLEQKAQEATSEELDPAALPPAPPATGPAAEPKKPGRRRSAKAQAPPPPQQTDEERIAQGKRVLGARSKAKALAKAQAEAEAAEQAALAAKRAAERRAQAQRRLEERKRQQLIAEELKKPAEDMCLTDHKASHGSHSTLDVLFLTCVSFY